MDKKPFPDFRRYFEEWAEDLEMLRQNRLLGENAFITFARDRGIAVSGITLDDLSNLQKQGWLTSDGWDPQGRPLFHPFRMYPLHCILEKREETRQSNQIADLAVLLEPVYWPYITGYLSSPVDRSDSDFTLRRDQYCRKALQLVGVGNSSLRYDARRFFVATLDPNLWRERHEVLRFRAARVDKNGQLYLLLRLANWTQRERLKGRIALALWMRHIAEVIRRGFEEVHVQRWPEEDQAFEWWTPGARTRLYGSERPLDDALQSKPYLAWEYGLFTGSSVRWYVEGDTEFNAISYIFPERSKIGIELINLKGVMESDRDNIALKLREWLREDKEFRRFSMISFDRDVKRNVKTISQQVKQQNVVGFIAAHQPDFEFANFTIRELTEIAAQIDEVDGFSGNAVRHGDWTDITTARAFEERYRKISARGRGLKGKEWGEALAKYAEAYPHREDNGNERPFMGEILAALKGRIARYDSQKEHIRFDPDTFEHIDLRATGASPSPAEAEIDT